MTTDQATNRPPPALILKVINPVLKLLISSPLGGRIPLGVLKVTGRRSSRVYEIPIGVWPVEGGTVVFTDAPWLRNLTGGADVDLVYGGRTRRLRADVVSDPARVGPWLRAAIGDTTGTKVGLNVPAGHIVGDDEAAALRRAILLTPVDAHTL